MTRTASGRSFPVQCDLAAGSRGIALRPFPHRSRCRARPAMPWEWRGPGDFMEYIENKTFDEIDLGDGASLTRTLTEQDITLFAVMSGDINPAHVDPEYAKSSRFREVIGHGMWSGALISTVLGTEFPGPGTLYLGQDLRFRRPVKVGDTVTIRVEATAKDPAKGKVTLKTECVNQDGDVVVTGTAEVMAPTQK